MATLPEAGRALAEIIPKEKLDDAEMKQLRRAVEVLADAEFRECMLVRNSGPSKGQVAVSGYIKGRDAVEFIMRDNSADAGFDKVTTEEEAAALFQRILTAAFFREGTKISSHCDPLVLRVHVARKAPTQQQKDKAFAELLKTNPSAKHTDVRAKGDVEKRDGKPVFLPSLEHGALPPGANPLAYEPDGRYVLNHRKDMTNTLWFYLAGLAALVLAVATFRLWPAFLQVGVWYLSVTVLVVILGFFAIQLTVFVLLWGFGFDLWIFPKMFDELSPIAEWFTVVYSGGFTGGSWPLRILVLLAIAGAGVWLGTQPADTLAEMQQHSQQFVEELYSGKLLEGAAPGSFGPGRNIPTFEELQRLAEQEEEETEEAGAARRAAEAAAGKGEGEASSGRAAAHGDDEEDAGGDEDDDDMASLEASIMAELRAAEQAGGDDE